MLTVDNNTRVYPARFGGVKAYRSNKLITNNQKAHMIYDGYRPTPVTVEPKSLKDRVIGRLDNLGRVFTIPVLMVVQGAKIFCKFWISVFTRNQLNLVEEVKNVSFGGVARDCIFQLALGKKLLTSIKNVVALNSYSPKKEWEGLGDVFRGKYHDNADYIVTFVHKENLGIPGYEDVSTELKKVKVVWTAYFGPVQKGEKSSSSEQSEFGVLTNHESSVPSKEPEKSE